MSRTWPTNIAGPSPLSREIVTSAGNSVPSARSAVSSTGRPTIVDSPRATARASPRRCASRCASGTTSGASSCPITSSRRRPNMRSAAALNSRTRPAASSMITASTVASMIASSRRRIALERAAR